MHSTKFASIEKPASQWSDDDWSDDHNRYLASASPLDQIIQRHKARDLAAQPKRLPQRPTPTANATKVSLPQAWIKKITRADVPPRVKEYCFLVAAGLYAKQRKPIHSQVARAVLGERHYGKYLDVMRSLDGVERDEGYLTRAAHGNSARCKAWRFVVKSSLSKCQHIVDAGCGSLPCAGVQISRSTISRLTSALDRYGFDAESRRISEQFAANIRLPDGSELEDKTCRIGTCGRTYGKITNRPKEERRNCTVYGEKMVGVDAHALHPAIMVALFATGAEREKLIGMWDGNFYESMGGLLDESDVKKNFLAYVLYSRRSRRPLVSKFAAAFPDTSVRLAELRDSGEVYRAGWDEFEGTKYWKRTWDGQRELSHLFCRIEGEIFRGAQKQLYAEGIVTYVLHDSLLCAESDKHRVKQVVEQRILIELGFRVPAKFED